MLQGLKISRPVIQGSSFQRHVRYFSVKELSWCTPAGAPTKPKLPPPKKPPQESSSPISSKESKKQEPIDQFGIVAAISACKNRVIGINGKIPWSAPEDRRIFKSLTQDSILIIGRKTLEEHPKLEHVDHAKHCIVISKSMSDLDSYEIEDGSPNDVQLSLAKSLDEALHQARELNDACEKYPDDANETSNQDISCWVAGGERLYGEALRHRSLKELRLSWVHMDITPPSPEAAIPFARFPAKYYWDNKFKEISKTFHPGTNNTPAFEHCVYKPK
ncbi:unnamed protein product [Cylindrotheca closterium]|uniref:Bifunctional dihydrofolate reductase-thymidylate synthase n=1 Tax=Cylindrotheca closterium TaxID=2856 RepID=A0AAD2GDZ6_9STRA|nr:unnamed protein product [Cylindrotheca closterium]